MSAAPDTRATLHQQRLAFLDALGQGGLHHCVAVGRRWIGPVDSSRLTAAIRAVAHCDPMPVRFDGSNPQDANVVSLAAIAEPELAIGVHDLRVLVDTSVADRTDVVVFAHSYSHDVSWCDLTVAAIEAAYAGSEIAGPVSSEPTRSAADEQVFLASERGRTSMQWWGSALRGLPPALQLPHDRRRPVQSSYGAAVRRYVLDERTSRALAGAAAVGDRSIEILVVAAWAAIWSRYSGQDDIAIGTPAFGDRSGAYRLPLRVDTSDDPTLAALIEAIELAIRDRELHGAVPFAAIAAEVGAERDPSRHPLYQVVVRPAHPTAAPSPVGSETVSVPLAVDLGATEYDLDVEYEWDGQQLGVAVTFATDLFEPETIDDMFERYGRVVEALLSTPDVRLSHVALLDAAEQASMRTSGAGPDDPTAPRCLDAVFFDTASRCPDLPAVSGGGRTLTYVELGARARRLAHLLRERGVGHGDLVGVATNRDADLLTATIAIHSCGAAYLPLEPTYPQDRLEYIVSDAGARVVVASPSLASLMTALHDDPVVIDDAVLAQYSSDDVVVAHTPDDLAYVIYTSGSTGRPKGVMVEHHGVINLLREMAQRPGLREGEVMVGVTTPAFDLSVPDLHLPMYVGAHLVFADPLITADPKPLAALLDAVDCRLMQATPATWRMLLDAGWNGRPSMRVVCGGEGFTAALAAPLAARVDAMWNFYGPTEATVWCTSAHLVEPTDPIPLGTALPNMAVYVGDARGAPVPLGVPGELSIAGLGLARGYLGRPELTADRFIDTDDVRFPRAYRTGDLVRRRRNGTLEFMGRIDHQVKLRGYRIELGEIEQGIAAQPGVREVVVVVRTDDPADPQIVAYVVGECDSMSIRRSLAQHLPGYMVPTHVIVLDDFPRTPNGKTDRSALPAPTASVVSTTDYVAPRGPIEETLAIIWRDVLGLERVGINDNFFELGGHSLRMTQVLTRIAEMFGVDVLLRDMYSEPTIAALAQRVTLEMLDDPELAALLDDIE